MERRFLVSVLIAFLISLATSNPSSQRNALNDLYLSTGGPFWWSSYGWNATDDYCQWFGVECNLSSDVIALNLYMNNLTGSIPPSISQLSSLVTVDMWNNQIGGPLPASLFTIPTLNTVNLWYNNLSGVLPSSISTSLSLIQLNLWSNRLEGSFPSEITDPQSARSPLQYLYLGGNKLSGVLPDTFDNFPQLVNFYLDHNFIQTPLPESLAETPLIKLSLFNNSMTGHLSKNWSSSLVELDLSNNRLSGQLPSSLLQCFNLEVLKLYGNQFQGSLNFSQLNRLRELDADSNQFSGLISFPNNASMLQRVDVSYNLLDGLSNFSSNSLKWFNASNNRLKTPIPASISRWNSIIEVYLQNNLMMGGVPDLSLLSALKVFRAENNLLNGTIQGNGFPSVLSEFNVSNNGLTTIKNSFGIPPALTKCDMSNNDFDCEVLSTTLQNTCRASCQTCFSHIQCQTFNPSNPTCVNSTCSLSTFCDNVFCSCNEMNCTQYPTVKSVISYLNRSNAIVSTANNKARDFLRLIEMLNTNLFEKNNDSCAALVNFSKTGLNFNQTLLNYVVSCCPTTDAYNTLLNSQNASLWTSSIINSFEFYSNSYNASTFQSIMVSLVRRADIDQVLEISSSSGLYTTITPIEYGSHPIITLNDTTVQFSKRVLNTASSDPDDNAFVYVQMTPRADFPSYQGIKQLNSDMYAISFVRKNAGEYQVPNENWDSPMNLTVPITWSSSDGDLSCVWLDRTSNPPQWSTNRCTIQLDSKRRNTATCLCDHLTEFAVAALPTTATTVFTASSVRTDAIGQPNSNNTKTILIAVLIPVFFILAIVAAFVIFIVLLRRKKRVPKKKGSPEESFTIAMSDSIETPATESDNHEDDYKSSSIRDDHIEIEMDNFVTVDIAGSGKELKVPAAVLISGVIVETKIGKGHFGHVYKGVWNGTPVALKKINNENNYEECIKEFSVLQKLNHPHIVRLFGLCLHEKQIMMVLELCPLGSLLHFLRDPDTQNTIPDEVLLSMSLDVAAGMWYLEVKEVIHRDLGARNILVMESQGNYTVKIADFGLSKESNYYKSVNGVIAYKWASPETLQYGRCTSKSDVWSYAICLWEIYSLGKEPYLGMNNKEAADAVVDGYRLPKPDRCPESMYELMTQCWEYDAAKRPGFRAIYDQLREMKEEMDTEEQEDFDETTDSRSMASRENLYPSFAQLGRVQPRESSDDEINDDDEE